MDRETNTAKLNGGVDFGWRVADFGLAAIVIVRFAHCGILLAVFSRNEEIEAVQTGAVEPGLLQGEPRVLRHNGK